MNRCAKSMDMMISWVEIKITYLISWSIITKIVSNPENDRSFSIKSIEIEFHSYLGIESCLKDP